MADGCVMHHKRIRHLKTCDSLQERFLTQLSLSIKDYDHLLKFSNAIESTYPINIYTAHGYTNTEYGRILIEDKSLYESLILKGVKQNKTFNEDFPYEHVGEEYYIDVARGIFDADGCISKHKSRHGTDEYEFTINGTKEIIRGVQKVLGDTSNVKLSKRNPERGNNNYTLKHGGNQITYKYMSLLYENADVYLERKYQKYLQLKELLNSRIQ